MNDRNTRKKIVFHVLYGTHPDVPEYDVKKWRSLCVNYIDGKGPLPPLSYSQFLISQNRYRETR